MSWINLKQIILGIAGTTAQKFTIATPDTPDGTAKLSRGVPTALGQDILTIDANGYMTAEQTPPATDNTKKIASTAWAKLGFAVLLSGNGYLKLPTWLGGVIFQWGSLTLAAANVGQSVSYGLAHPSAVFVGVCSISGGNPSGVTCGMRLDNLNSFTVFCTNSYTVNWVTIGC